jgi:hypothetical protein
MFLRGLAKLLPLIVHEVAGLISDKIRERRQRKELEKSKNKTNEKS